MPHPAGTGGLPPLSLDGPVVLPDLSLGVATGCAHFLLDIEGDLTTPAAQGVGLIAPLSKGAGSLGHEEPTAEELSKSNALLASQLRTDPMAEATMHGRQSGGERVGREPRTEETLKRSPKTH